MDVRALRRPGTAADDVYLSRELGGIWHRRQSSPGYTLSATGLENPSMWNTIHCSLALNRPGEIADVRRHISSASFVLPFVRIHLKRICDQRL